MNKYIVLSGLLLSSLSQAEENNFYHKELIQCGKEGCEVVCNEPGQRWATYLQSQGNIEVTYFFNSGVRQLKADVGNGEYTILDTNPSYQSCRITGVSG